MADALSGRTEGIAATVAETARALNEQHPGLLGADTHLFSDVDELLASDYAKKHPFTDEELARMRGAEGFFDKSTGKSIVIAGNVELRAGETADSALRRVILHERVGHHGLDVLLNAPGRDGKASIHRRRWEELSGKIPPEELAAIAGEGGYQHLAGNNAALALEWFARKAESDPSLLTKPGFIRELWERFKLMATDLMYAYGNKDLLKDADLETQTCELLMRARQAAVRGRERMESGTPLFNDRQDSSSVVKSVIGDANAKISSDRMAKYSTTIDSMQDADSFTDPRLQFSFSPFKPLGFILQRWNGIVDRWLQRWNGIVDRWLNREDLGREPIHLGMTPPVLVAAGAAPRSIMVPLPCWQK